MKKIASILMMAALAGASLTPAMSFAKGRNAHPAAKTVRGEHRSSRDGSPASRIRHEGTPVKSVESTQKQPGAQKNAPASQAKITPAQVKQAKATKSIRRTKKTKRLAARKVRAVSKKRKSRRIARRTMKTPRNPGSISG